MFTKTVKATTCFQWILIFWMIGYSLRGTDCLFSDRRVLDRNHRVMCSKPDPVPNGEIRIKRGGALMRHLCHFGYTLMGPRNTPCVMGKWQGDRPVCAKSGCSTTLEGRDNGKVQLVNHYEMILYCSEGYNLAGNRFAYCNGTDWDRRLGECRKRQNRVEHECDFETDDICGWVSDQSGRFLWKRVMAANVFVTFQTGPRHDHTTMSASGGHYMLMESYGDTSSSIAFTSPIYNRDLSLKTACCFRFYFFMYGSGVGDLDVLVKPISLTLIEMQENKEEYIKFHKSGNQNNIWNEAHFNIPEMEEDFQIVFLASGAKSHLSDIAIDDVKLLTGTECKALDKPAEEPDDSSEYETTTTEEALFDIQSCVSRCGTDAAGIMRKEGKLIGICSCHLKCLEDKDCCPDFVTVCLEVDLENSTYYPLTGADEDKIETTKLVESTKSTSTTTTTTTTRKPDTPRTTTTTSTTTKAPTSSTRKPTTTSTTSTTTTTRTPMRALNTTTKATTTSKIPTTTTPKTTTTRKPTITTKMTTTTMKKPTTTVRTTTTAIPWRVFTMPISSSTKTTTTTTTIPTTITDISIKQNKQGNSEKTEMQRNSTKQIWTWQNKQPEDQTKRSHGSAILLALFGLLLTAIIVGAIYRQRKAAIVIWLEQLLRKNHTSGNGEEDSTSIIANFTPKDNATNNESGNRMTFSKPKTGRKSKSKRFSIDQQSLADDQPFECSNDSDGIPLL